MYSAYERRDFSSIAPSAGQNIQNLCFRVRFSQPQAKPCVYDLLSALHQSVIKCQSTVACIWVGTLVLCGLRYLGPESGSGAGRADGSVAREGDGQTSDPVLAGLVLAHQPALRDAHQTR